jgi:hypothetical protein
MNHCPDFPKVVSAAAADALERGVQQLVAFIRHSLGIGVIAMAASAGKSRSMHAMALTAQTMTTKSVTAKSMSASRVGRE